MRSKQQAASSKQQAASNSTDTGDQQA